MTKIIHNPAIIAALAVILGVAAGIVPLWRAGDRLVTQAMLTHVQKAKAGKVQGWDFWTIEVDNLASELKDEKARLKKQSELLDQRAARIAGEQQELDKVRTNIEGMRKEIAEKVIEIQADESKNLRALSQTYAALTPKAAVAIIREMDDMTVVKILSLMKPDVVAPIFEEMSKTSDREGLLSRRAAVISEKLRLMKSTRPPTSP
jgi:flagellar motility protein MotE (MotC chaperone)